MKILAVRGKNIASLDGEFELDFTSEPLASAGIYAIAGPTGAGKSSLLDTMCLALFARTPRTDQAKENEVWLPDVNDSALTQGDPRNLLRRGTASGYAEADFVALNGYRYRARWAVRRARDKENGALQNFRVTLSNLDTRTEEQGNRKEIQARIVELVGLTFSQFTRSVLLAQNDFSTFLKADQGEKASLLEKLTGTEMFSAISQSIYQQNARAKEAYSQLCNQIGGIELLTAEAWQEAEELRRQKEETLRRLEEEKKKVETRQEWFGELAALVNEVDEVRNEWARAQEAWENGRRQAAYLDLVVQVQEARSLYDSEKKAACTAREKAAQLQAASIRMQTARQALEEVRAGYARLQEEQAACEQRCKDAAPALQAAGQSDIRIEEAVRRVSELKQRWEKAAAERTQHEARDRQLENSLRENAGETASIAAWLDKHRSREHVAEQTGAFGLLLDRAEESCRGITEAERLRKKLTSVIREQGGKAETVKKDAGEKADALKELENRLAACETSQREVRIEALQEEIRLARERKELLASAAFCWKELYGVQLELRQRNMRLDGNRKASAQLRESREAQAGRMAAVSERKTQSEQIYNGALLAVAGDVESMRSQLQAGSPCPVCGSTSHPYAGAGEKLHRAFDAIRHEVQEVSRQYDAELKEAARLKQEIASLEAETVKLESETVALEVRNRQLSATWQSFRLPADVPAPPENRETWFAAVRREADEQIERLQRLESGYAARQQEMQRLQQARIELHRQVTALNREAEAALAEKALSENKLAACEENLRELEKSWQTTRLAVDELFGSDKWQTGWTENPAGFRKTLAEFAALWKEKKEQLQQAQTVRERLSAERQSLAMYLPSLLKEETQCKAHYESESQQVTALREERMRLFGGRPVAEVEQDFKRERESVKKRLDETQEALNTASHVYEQNRGITEQLEKDLHACREEAATCQKQLDGWLDAFNASRLSPVTYGELAGLLAKDGQWIQAERAALEKLSSGLAAVKAKLREREDKVKACDARRAELGINEATPESLRTLYGQVQEQIEREAAALSECVFKLRRHAENKERIRTMEKELEQLRSVYEQWSKLNDLAGSSDGGKFRRIAQGYTLDILLSYANIHLRSLSHRYRLERVADTLALQVIDKDMCDEVRTVHSLSGGESFLVSLGLALGLSSLSSNRMKVESLFIDEGFGSLDADTLRIAMDALESLRTQGRKIGVISHVQEMTERIPVQVRVEKMGNGRSRLSIVG